MNTLSINTGINEYELAPNCVITFNPTDTAFIAKLYSHIEQLDKMQDAYRENLKDASDPRTIFGVMEKADKEIRAEIDSVFNIPVCDAVFGDMHVTAMSTNGVPAWFELFLAIIDQCGSAADITGKKGKAYIDKYSKKYMRK